MEKENGFLRFFEVIAALCSITGLILAIVNIEGLAIILPIFYTIIIIGLISYIAIQDSKNRKITGILNSVSQDIHHISHIIRDTLDKEINSEFKALVKSCMKDICNAVKSTFEKLVHSEISVCIKIVIEKDDIQYVSTLARDKDSHISRSELNALRKLDKSNTAFNQLFNESQQYFFSDDLENMYKEGNYKSTIVVPIRVLHEIENQKEYAIIGFLAIDSIIKNKFGKNIEMYKNLLGSVADSLYILLLKFKSG